GKDNYDASKYDAKVSNGLNIGSKIEFTLPDQFDNSHSLKDDTKTLILSFAKATGHTIKAFLNAQPKDYLPSRDAMFVADISPMPTIIRNTFALPDLKKSAFSVLLIYDEDIAKQIKDEDKKDKIIIVKLQNKQIKSIDYIETEKELESALN
ncbi:MAG: hypothetical protein GXO30_00425, partial [Epsilonproteobacteria bacterium]|nr:hypothetical protein [Campylobacterota bacterium]